MSKPAAVLGAGGLDRSGRLVAADEAFAEVVGRERPQLEGTHFAAVLPGLDFAREQAHFEALLAGKMGAFSVEARHRTTRGELRVARFTVCRVPGDAAFAATITAESLTDQQRAEQRLSAQHAVAKILAEAATIAEASPQILRAICESLDLDLGGMWLVESDGGEAYLRAIEGWVAQGIHAPEFLSASTAMRPKPGEALPGTAWVRKTPVWIEDLPKGGPIFLRGPIALREGLHGAFAFPIMLGTEVLAVMDFFTREVRRPDADLVQMLATFGSQIGQFMERKRVAHALSASEHQLQAIIDNTPSCVYVTDLSGRILLLNRRTEQIAGVASEQARGRQLEDLLPAELRPSTVGAREMGSLLEREDLVVSADGLRTYFSHRFLLNGLDGRPYAVCGISTDITAAKRAEYDLRALAAELSAAEDQERRKFARDLHDSIGQTMSALKMDLERGAKEGAGVDAIRRALETVDNLIGQVRTMTFDLYPAMLDDLGLVPTLYTYAEQFSRRTKISSSVTEIGARRPLPMAATNYLFRAIRELLNNVAKHATAKEILIAIHWRQDAVRIAVADDGSGFDPQIALIPRLRRGLGLADIRERLRVMGGALMIESSPGSGSHVVLDVPIKEENLG